MISVIREPAAAAELEALDQTNLPVGWEWAFLSQICDLNPEKPNANVLPADALVTFVPMPAIDAAEGSITKPELRPYAHARRGHPSFQDGDVLMAKITPCMENGKAAVARDLSNRIGFGSTEFHVLRPLGGVIPEYVYHFIRQEAFRSAAAAEMTGSVGQKRVPVEFLQRALLPIPPVAEQERIVAKVREVLLSVRAAQKRLEGVRTILRRFRQSVFAAACSGRLTADWRFDRESKMGGGPEFHMMNETENASAQELPPTWHYTTVGQVTRNFDGRRVPVKATDRARRSGPYPYYGASGIIDWVDNYLFEGEFLLVSEDGANLLARSTPIAFVASGQFWVNNHAHVLQTVAGVTMRYLELYTNGLDIQQFVTGSAQPKLTQAALNQIPLPVPPPIEQQEIVDRVETLFGLADRVEKRVTLAALRSERLTEAILGKAFRGELVPTEAELARQEGRDYEPASVLLERIRAQRNGSGPAPARRASRRRAPKAAAAEGETLERLWEG